MIRVFTRLVADAALVAIMLFASAGTLLWSRAWVLLAVMLVVRVASAIVVHRVNPALVRERAKLPLHGDQPLADKLLLFAVIATGFVALPALAGRDVFRWHALPQPGTFVSSLGLSVFVLGWIIKGLALRANAFAVSVVRLQHERQHAVADSGVYAIVRHPFYAATPLVFVGSSLWLESYAAALAAVVPIVLIVVRLRLEERLLLRELPGYSQYAQRVPHRLLPGIW